MAQYRTNISSKMSIFASVLRYSEVSLHFVIYASVFSKAAHGTERDSLDAQGW
jgi:hypothetical protein